LQQNRAVTLARLLDEKAARTVRPPTQRKENGMEHPNIQFVINMKKLADRHFNEPTCKNHGGEACTFGFYAEQLLTEYKEQAREWNERPRCRKCGEVQ
jgi:hypothetical protein